MKYFWARLVFSATAYMLLFVRLSPAYPFALWQDYATGAILGVSMSMFLELLNDEYFKRQK